MFTSKPKIELFSNAKPAPTIKPPTIDHFCGRLPASLPPSTYIRRWDSAAILGASAAAVAFAATGFIAWHEWSFLNTPPGGLLMNLEATLKTMGWLATGGQSYQDYMHWYWGDRLSDIGLISRFAFIAASTGLAGQWAFRRSLVARNGIRHVSGAQRLTGVDAVKGFQHEALNMGLTKKNAFMSLHPSALWPARQWKYHLLVDGGTGSGKTQVLLHWLRQIIEGNHRLFLYDIKGDFTSYFLATGKRKGLRRAVLLSPFDKRSYVWNISRDVDTASKAALFAQSMIPVEEGNGKYWSQSAQMLLEATIISLQHDMPGQWGFFDLKRRLDMGREEFAKLIEKFSAKAANTIADDSQASTSVMGTLSAYTACIDKLAEAWPRPTKGKTISLSDWCADGYKGPRQIIVQSGTDQDLASAVIAAMVNVCASEIVNPKLKDDMTGRHMFFTLDEFTSLKKLNVGDLLDKSRSKGVSCALAYQAVSQITERYGQNVADAMVGMVGTKVHCKQLSSETRNKVIQLAGRRRIAVTNNTVSGGFTDGVAGSSSVSEEERDILTPQDLSTLGPVYDKKGNFLGVKALVNTGGDYFELLFPPQHLSTKDHDGQEVPGIVPAAWTLPGYISPLPRTRGVPQVAEETEALGGTGNGIEQIKPMEQPIETHPFKESERLAKTQKMEVVHVRPDKEHAVPVEPEDVPGHVVTDMMVEHFGGAAMNELMNALMNGDDATHSNNRVTPIKQEVQLKRGRE